MHADAVTRTGKRKRRRREDEERTLGPIDKRAKKEARRKE